MYICIIMSVMCIDHDLFGQKFNTNNLVRQELSTSTSAFTDNSSMCRIDGNLNKTESKRVRKTGIEDIMPQHVVTRSSNFKIPNKPFSWPEKLYGLLHYSDNNKKPGLYNIKDENLDLVYEHDLDGSFSYFMTLHEDRLKGYIFTHDSLRNIKSIGFHNKNLYNFCGTRKYQNINANVNFISTGDIDEHGNIYGFGSFDGELSFMKSSVDNPFDYVLIKKLTDSSDYCVSICYNKDDDYFYGVDRNQNFVRLDPVSGERTMLVNFELPDFYHYRAGLVYDPEKKVYYWNPQFLDGSAFVTIDALTFEIIEYSQSQNGEEFFTLFLHEPWEIKDSDVPSTPSNLQGVVSEDNMSLHLTWDPVKTGWNNGEQNGYIDPNNVSYVIYIWQNDGVNTYWSAVAEDIKETSYNFTLPEGANQDYYDVGVQAVNTRGSNMKLQYVNGILGTPYNLPFVEDFENQPLSTNPWIIWNFNDVSKPQWEVVNNIDIPAMIVSHEGRSLGCSGEIGSAGMLQWPKFSTKNKSSQIWVDLSALTYVKIPKVTLLAKIHGNDEFLELGEIDFNQGFIVEGRNGFLKNGMFLPEELLNKEWVSLYIAVEFTDQNQYLAIDEIEVIDERSRIDENGGLILFEGNEELNWYPGVEIDKSEILELGAECTLVTDLTRKDVAYFYNYTTDWTKVPLPSMKDMDGYNQEYGYVEGNKDQISFTLTNEDIDALSKSSDNYLRIVGSGASVNKVTLYKTKCKNPSIIFSNKRVVIIPGETDKVKTYYTLDGSDPTENSSLYNDPLYLTGTKTVKARSYKEGDAPSDIVEFLYVQSDYTAKKPVISFDGPLAIISRGEGDEVSLLYYSIDNSDITSMRQYTEPFPLEYFATVYAQARRPDYFFSEIVERQFDNFEVEKPTITHSADKLTFSHTSDNVEIYYTLDRSKSSTTESIKANGVKCTPGTSIPFRRNGFVAAYAAYTMVGSPDVESEISTFEVDSYKVSDPSISYYNKTVVITGSTEDGIYTCYTTDGSEPTETGTRYESPLSFSGTVSVRARSFKENWNPSEIVEFAYIHTDYMVKNPVITMDGSTVTISRAEGDNESTLYYSIGNDNPDSMTIYTSPITIDWNTTIYTQARLDGMFPSEVVSYEINSYELGKPAITHAYDKLTISHPRSDVDIYYTYDKAKAESTEAIKAEGLKWTNGASADFRHNGFVAAFATYAGTDRAIGDSKIETKTIDTYKVPNPEVFYYDKKVVITSSGLDGVRTYYTLDGSDPTGDCEEYINQLSFSENAEIRVRSFRDGWNPSDVIPFEYIHSDYVVKAPVINISGTVISIEAQDKDSELYYAIDNSEPSMMTRYLGEVRLDKNCTIFAQARKSGFFDSEVVDFEFSILGLESPVISYDGRYIKIETNDPLAKAYYTFDNNDMTTAIEAPAMIDAMGLGKVRAVARRSGYQDSDVEEHDIRYYSDSDHAILSDEGDLKPALDWTLGDNSRIRSSFSISGPMGLTDYSCLSSIEVIRHLNLMNVTSKEIPDSAFRGAKLVSLELPAAASSYGKGMFTGCEKLCAITLNSGAPLIDEVIGGIDNPNLICILTGAYQAVNKTNVPASIRNVVTSDNKTASLTLAEDYPFYSPKAFTAEKASLTRTFSKPTELGGSQGWETISIPFDVDEIRQEDSLLKPFAVFDGTFGTKPFWLYCAINADWTSSPRIEANIPYLISMPHNDAYGSEYSVIGEVMFSGNNVDVSATSETFENNYDWQFNAVSHLHANYSRISAKEGYLVVNDNWNVNEPPGSFFSKGDHDVKPFEGYVTTTASVNKIKIFDSSSVDLPDDLRFGVRAEGKDILITTPLSATLRIFDLNGCLVRVVRTEAGVTLRVSGLTKGIYFVGDRKVMLTQ